MTHSSVPGREPKQPQEAPPVREGASHRTSAKGSGAIRLNNLNQSSPTAVTRPEMKAVRPSRPEILDAIESTGTQSAPLSPPLPSIPSAQPSWRDAPTLDPITEQTGRATELSLIPVVVQKRDRALLLRMDGVHAGQVISLDKANMTVGRHPENLIVIDDTGVSRHHAEIRVESGRVLLIDQGARNGTLVQGVAVSGTVELQDGDFIQLGPRVGFRFSLTDTKQERLLQRLYESSNRDALTGAYNRKHFDERFLAELAYAARNRCNTALLLFDIDFFKKVNDTYGHAAGDAVLRQVAGVTMTRLRTEDVFARIGGEEFAVLLRGVTVQGAARLGERLRTSISAVPTLFEGRPIPITISVGCAALKATDDPSKNETLIRLADERLYRAKNGGRNRVVFD